MLRKVIVLCGYEPTERNIKCWRTHETWEGLNVNFFKIIIGIRLVVWPFYKVEDSLSW